MGIVAVKIKIMPTSPTVNTKKIGEKAKELVESIGGKNCSITEEPIAFGLNALIVFFAWFLGHTFKSRSYFRASSVLLIMIKKTPWPLTFDLQSKH